MSGTVCHRKKDENKCYKCTKDGKGCYTNDIDWRGHRSKKRAATSEAEDTVDATVKTERPLPRKRPRRGKWV
jgi:hypothetical protein